MSCSSTLSLKIRQGLEPGFQDSSSHDFQLKSVLQCDYKTTGLSGTVFFGLLAWFGDSPSPHHGPRSSRFQGGGQVRSLAHILPSALEPSSFVP